MGLEEETGGWVNTNAVQVALVEVRQIKKQTEPADGDRSGRRNKRKKHKRINETYHNARKPGLLCTVREENGISG